MAGPIGNMVIRVDLDGSGFNKGIAGLNRQMRLVSKEMSANLSKFSRYDNSLEKSKVRVDGLTKRQQVQAQKVRELKNNYDQLSKETGENSAKTQAAAAKYNQAYAELNKYERELNEATAEMKRLETQQRALNTTMGKIGSKFSQWGPKLQDIGKKMQAVGKSMTLHVTAPVVAGFGLAAKKSIDFDDSMRKVKATSGATSGEFQQLRDKALEMGAKTKFSASQSAEALNYMALAGWDTKDMLNGIDGVMQLAAASGEDLAEVSDIVTDGLSAFGLKAKDSSHFADVLAQTSSKANTDVHGLGEAFKYVAPVAGSFGFSVEDTSIALGLMANSGVKASQAGTALKTMMTRLTGTSGEAKKTMEKLGITITDSQGQMLPFRDIMDQLRKSIGGLSEAQQSAAVKTLFGQEAMSGILPIINASDEDYKKLTKSIDNSTGASERMSKEMEGGIGGSIRRMKSAIESMAISIGDVLAPHIRRAADLLASLADKFTSMPGWAKTAVVGIGVFAAALGPLILTMGAFTASIGSIMGTLGPLMIGIKTAGGLMGFLGTKAPLAAKGLTLVGTAFKFMLGPIGLAIAAVVAIGTAFVIAYKKSETFRNIVNKVINPVVNGFKKLWGVAQSVFNSLKSLLSGNTLPTVDLLSKIMPKASAKKVALTLLQIRQAFIDAFGAIWRFAQEIGNKLTRFWKDNGDDIIQAFKNIGEFFKGFFIEARNQIGPNLKEFGDLIKTIFNGVIVPTIKVAMKVIWQIMKFTWPLIKVLIVDTWENIKSIIKGALDVILGIVKVFSGVFTGQWDKVWEGVKQIFKGAVVLIWNLIQLWFMGKILKVVKIFGGFFKGIISKSFNGVKGIIGTSLKFIWSIISTIFKRILTFTKGIFTILREFISSIWRSIKNIITNHAKGLFNNIKGVFTSLYRFTRSIFSSLKNWLSNIWRSIKNTVTRYASALWSNVKRIFTNLFNGSRSIFNRLKSWLISLWSSLKKRVVNIASSLWSNVKRIFTNLFNGTRSIFNRVKSIIVNIWNSIKRSVTGIASSLWKTVRRTFNNMANGLKSIIGRIKDHITGMVKAIKDGLNGLIKGLNWVGSKLSLPKIPKLSTGTQRINRHIRTTSDGRLKQGTMAVVGDKGPGNGKGLDGRRELIQYPNGRTALTPAKDTTTWLPKGSRVISGSMRQQYEEAEGAGMYPRFSVGTWLGKSTNWLADKTGAIGSAIKKSASWLTDKIGDVMDFIDSPGKLFNKVMSLMGVDFGSLTKGMGIVGQIARAAFAKIKKGAIDWIKGGFDAQAGDGSVFDGFRILQPYSAPPKAPNPNYPFNGGVHHGVDYDTPVGTPIRTPMGGRVRSWYDNYGGGKAITVQKGRTFLWFMHLSEQLRRTGEQIKAGQLIGKSGNTGSMTNYRHLHFQVNQGGEANRFSTDPIPWLRKNDKTGGGKGYPAGSGAAYASRVISQAQSILGGRYKSRYIHDQMMRVAKRESNYQPNVVNNWDINALRGDPSRGLFQIIGSTFRANAKSGYTNFNNPLHQAISATRYIVARYGWGGFKRAGDYAYATGGKVYNGLYNLGEEGYPEWIIPTDPSRASDAAKLLALASKDISKNKRPKNFNSGSIGNDDTRNSKLESKLDTMIGLLIKLVGSNDTIADKDFSPVIDNFGLSDFINSTVDKRERNNSRKSRFKPGGALI
ncbi:phage tail tape measure protein [Staphylococcus schleiferi]|uniref:phage tail tape measure protein n=1 Tax=Staphylococcus schleiferi TaxID=1295 RepID=UPI0021D3ABEB|nr:phage tail tape measure protein [Staphylococcus schleiferi]UXR54481.1 phage tail tape measure protein [Staphylococcus schleiferi]UXR61387.1 phage tail tape measure protein [Staphylococcus schleiferi]